MFRFLDTNYKRKSAAITSAIMCLLLIAIFFVGMKYLDPPEEYGIAVNFGTSDFGMGDVQPTEPLKSAPQEVKEQEEEVVQEQVTPSTTKNTEEVITQDIEDALAIKKQVEAKKEADEVARLEKIKQDAIAKQKAEEAAKRKNLDALIGGVSNSNGTATGGEGSDNTAGDKGKVTGDPNAGGYYGNGGNGSGGDYYLKNREPKYRPKPDYICDEEGLVVVQIEVDVNGRVTKATAGVKGSTNTAACLLSQAKEAALKTTWQPDSKAPSKQVGTIKYRFSLSQ